MKSIPRDELEDLKAKNLIEEIVREWDYYLIESGGKLVCPDHPGLYVNPASQMYSWQDLEEGGDVLDWIRNREAWSFEQAVNYLRLRLTNPKRKASGKTEEQESVIGGLFRPSGSFDLGGIDFSDKRLQKALDLGRDYPGIRSLIAMSPFSVISGHLSVLPNKFFALSGELSDENCVFCGKSFPGWSDAGLVYLAIEMGGNYEVTQDLKSAGVYCGDCVEKFRKWIQALWLIIDYQKDRL